jgi:capsular polysaccharide biosynthesis protein
MSGSKLKSLQYPFNKVQDSFILLNLYKIVIVSILRVANDWELTFVIKPNYKISIQCLIQCLQPLQKRVQI